MDRKALVREYLAENKTITTDDALVLFGTSRNAAYRFLVRMVDTGELTQFKKKSSESGRSIRVWSLSDLKLVSDETSRRNIIEHFAEPKSSDQPEIDWLTIGRAIECLERGEVDKARDLLNRL